MSNTACTGCPEDEGDGLGLLVSEAEPERLADCVLEALSVVEGDRVGDDVSNCEGVLVSERVLSDDLDCVAELLADGDPVELCDGD